MATLAISIAPPPSAPPRPTGAPHGTVPPPMHGAMPAAHTAAPPPHGTMPPPYGAPGGSASFEAFGNAATGAMPLPGGGPRRTAALAVPQNQTMMIATPPGFKSHPPRKRGPWLIATGAIVVVVAAVVIALVASGGGASTARVTPPPAPGPGTGAAPALPSPGSSGSAVSPPEPQVVNGGGGGTVAVKLARIQLTSEPDGAEVLDAAGRKLGVTPTEIGLPADGAEHELTFRHPARKERKKTIAATGDMTVTVVLSK